MSRPITDVLRDIRQGRVVDEATARLAEVVQAVMLTQKAGSVTIKLKVNPDKGDTTVVVLESEVEAKVPRLPLPKAVFYANGEGDLFRNDPNQKEMFSEAPLGDLNRITGEVR